MTKILKAVHSGHNSLESTLPRHVTWVEWRTVTELLRAMMRNSRYNLSKARPCPRHLTRKLVHGSGEQAVPGERGRKGPRNGQVVEWWGLTRRSHNDESSAGQSGQHWTGPDAGAWRVWPGHIFLCRWTTTLLLTAPRPLYVIARLRCLSRQMSRSVQWFIHSKRLTTGGGHEGDHAKFGGRGHAGQEWRRDNAA